MSINLTLRIIPNTFAPDRKPVALVFVGKDTFEMKEQIKELRCGYLEVPPEINNGKRAWVKFVNPSEVMAIVEVVKSWGASIDNSVTPEQAAEMKAKEDAYNKAVEEREANLPEFVRGRGWNGKFYGYGPVPHIYLNGDRYDLSEHEHQQLLHATDPNAPAPGPAPVAVPAPAPEPDEAPEPTPSGVVWPAIDPQGKPIEVDADDDLPF